METLLSALFVLTLILYSLRISLFNNWKVIAVYFVFPTVIPYSIYPWLIEQNNKYVNELLQQSALMSDFALLIILEALLLIGGTFAISKSYLKEKLKIVQKRLKYVPALSPILALTYFELQAFYVIRDYTFEQVAYGFLGGTILALVAVVYGIKWLIQEWEIRLELSFVLYLFQILIGIGIGSFYNSIDSTSFMDQNIWKPFTVLSAIVLLVVVVGFVFANYKRKKEIKKIASK